MSSQISISRLIRGADGRSIVAFHDSENQADKLWRYNNTDLSRDMTFGTNGTAPGGSLLVNIDNNGKILQLVPGGIQRLNADGIPDTTFGQDGIVQSDYGNVGTEYAAIAQSDHQIVIIGYSYDSSTSNGDFVKRIWY